MGKKIWLENRRLLQDRGTLSRIFETAATVSSKHCCQSGTSILALSRLCEVARTKRKISSIFRGLFFGELCLQLRRNEVCTLTKTNLKPYGGDSLSCSTRTCALIFPIRLHSRNIVGQALQANGIDTVTTLWCCVAATRR